MAKYSDFVYMDHDLYDVLKKANNDELAMLAETLCTKVSCDIDEKCRDVAAIVNELQLMGGNSFANVSRGHGVCYDEIVTDVADQVKVKLDGCRTIGEKEWLIIEKIVEKAEEKMDSSEKKEFYDEIRKQTGDQTFNSVLDLLGNQAFYNSFRLIIVSTIVRQLLVRLGVQSAGKLVAGRLATILAGPIGWVLGGIWAVIDFSGPAYSVTVPGVMLVAMIRTRLAGEEAIKEVEDN